MGITCGSGIICGPIWGSFAVGDHLRSRDHLRRCTVLSHARGNAARDVLEDEGFNNSCEDDTTSESKSSDSYGENTYVEESFEVLFVPEEDMQHVN